MRLGRQIDCEEEISVAKDPARRFYQIMTQSSFIPGATVLLSEDRSRLESADIALVSHAAAVDINGTPTADLLQQSCGDRLKALFAPEHGYFGTHGAGAAVSVETHPFLDLPVYPLYGEHLQAGLERLADFDVLIYDLQDLGVRPYTYVSVLRRVLEKAASSSIPVLVADRPVPLPNTVDGPVCLPDFRSFVSDIPSPVVYGMTPGETARWLAAELNLNIDLHVSTMRGYDRQSARGSDWPAWTPPSPAITSWEAGQCFSMTVFLEAFPSIDHGRGTALPFQCMGAPCLPPVKLCEILRESDLSGIHLTPHRYVPGTGTYKGETMDGLRIAVTDPDRFQPVRSAFFLLWAIQELVGKERLWDNPTTRSSFLDLLLGTDSVRNSLQDGERPDHLVREWETNHASFTKKRADALLYSRK